MYGEIINEEILIMRYRIISLSKKIYFKISNEKLILNSNVPLKKYNKLGIEEIHINNKLYPNIIILKD